jgi:hypothetical protein
MLVAHNAAAQISYGCIKSNVISAMQQMQQKHVKTPSCIQAATVAYYNRPAPTITMDHLLQQ